MRQAQFIAFALALLSAHCTKLPKLPKPPEPPEPPAEEALRFSPRIEGILSKHCFDCHGIRKREAELDLRTVEAILRGGESGPAIVAGEPGESLMLDMIHEEQMPPEGELLSAEEIGLLRRWVAEGAR